MATSCYMSKVRLAEIGPRKSSRLFGSIRILNCGPVYPRLAKFDFSRLSLGYKNTGIGM